MIYLNADYTGGKTGFYNSLPPSDADLDKIKPFTSLTPTIGSISTWRFFFLAFSLTNFCCVYLGTAVIFNHDTVHSGELVTTGNKYIVRSEIMFRRIEKPSEPFNSNDLMYMKAVSLYAKSDALELQGDVKGALKFYLEALELQSRLPSITTNLNSSQTQNGHVLPTDIFYHVILYALLITFLFYSYLR